MPVVGVAPRPAHPARVVARVFACTVAVTVAAVLSATLMPQTTDPAPRLRVPTGATPTIRLTLGGDISLTTADEPVIDVSAQVTQCRGGLFVRRPDTTLRCVPAETAVARAMPRTAFLRSGILKLGTGASEYRLYTHVEPTRLALKH